LIGLLGVDIFFLVEIKPTYFESYGYALRICFRKDAIKYLSSLNE